MDCLQTFSRPSLDLLQTFSRSFLDLLQTCPWAGGSSEGPARLGDVERHRMLSQGQLPSLSSSGATSQVLSLAQAARAAVPLEGV